MNIWDINVDEMVISKLIQRKSNSKHSIEYLDKFIRLLVLVLPKISGFGKTFKVKDGRKSNKLMPFRMDDEKLLEKYKTIWTNIKDLKNIKSNYLLVLMIDK